MLCSYENVRVLFTTKVTSKKVSSFKWADSSLFGSLRLLQVHYNDMKKYSEAPPVYHLQLKTADRVVFSLELAINAQIDAQSDRMVALQSHLYGHYVGFVLQNQDDKLNF